MSRILARNIARSFYANSQPEGAGATVRRCISGRNTIDPFLMCDIFEVSPPAGFPDHPHRGFETVTYMLEGINAHEDFAGNKGLIKPGGIQWMTAGRGIVHAEMPVTKSKGIQLWINLSAKDKMIEPSFQNLKDEEIKKANPEEGIEVKIIAGSSFGVKSDVFTRTPTMMLDFKLSKGKKIEQEIPKDYQGFIYVWEGSGYFGENRFKGQESYALFLDNNNGDYLPVDAADNDVRFMLFAGQPLKEPVVSYGPFVMNTEEEIFQTMSDYNKYINGFEKAKKWRSSIGDGVAGIDFEKEFKK
ncbi:15491_t:CDS:2 [Dentiscutata erythropus]|uniref:15491_t:CDS:1 n=1 Tax=Dentiscutata erythropus TaxID=1348616 RepID=A0A9N9NDR5_9GLOM|nr:15491_t:CDS:2 [Dentiscutata erythropus]